MNLFTRHPVVVGILVFSVTFFAIRLPLGPTTCRDGWESASIGVQGACSHHGGVSGWKSSLAFFAALVAGIGAGYRIYQKGQAEESARFESAQRAYEVKQKEFEALQVEKFVASGGVEGSPKCDLCGSLMVERRARRGKNQGSLFWGCSNYPRCRQTKSRALD